MTGTSRIKCSTSLNQELKLVNKIQSIKKLEPPDRKIKYLKTTESYFRKLQPKKYTLCRKNI